MGSFKNVGGRHQNGIVNLSPDALLALSSLMSPPLASDAVSIFAERGVEIMASHEQDGYRHYECAIELPGEQTIVDLYLAPEGEISAECDCGSADLCEHAGAAFLTVFGEVEFSRGSRGGRGAPEEVPLWRRELDALLPKAEQPEPAVELCLFVSVREPGTPGLRYRRDAAPLLAVRPGMRGSRGRWIKGQATWGALDRLDAAPPAVRALRALERLEQAHGHYYWGGNPEWILLHEPPGEDLWRALLRAREAGVAFVSYGAAQHPVEISDQAVEVVGTACENAGGLLLDAELRVGGERLAARGIWPIGAPTTAVARVEHPTEKHERVSLHPLAHQMSPLAEQLLARHEPLPIPARERSAFEAEYLPRILAAMPLESPDGSYEIPAPPANTLRLEIGHGESRTHLSWGWHRPAGVRDGDREAAILASLREACGEQAGLLWPGDASTGALPADATLGVAAGALFVGEVLPSLRGIEGLEIDESGDAPDYRPSAASPLVSVRSENDGDWFDLHFTVTIGEEAVEFSQLFTALALGEPVFVLPSGTYFPLEVPEFARLRQIVEEARALTDQPASGLRLNRHQIDLWEELSELGLVAAQEAQWWLAVQSLGDGEEVAPVDPPVGLHAELRDYQAGGVAWLHFLRTHGLGGILADDMGLGKTLQAITMMELAREEDPDRPPFLVVAPTSVVGNWAAECARFAPGLRVVIISAMTARRGEMLADAVAGAHVVVTSYALFRGEAEEYAALEWSGLILDEAQQIKNHASRGYRAARTLGAPFTLVITGTPIENNLLELWALTALAAPGLLGNRQRFTDFYRTPIEREAGSERLALLQRRLRPFLLRRTKDLVASELPPKQEQVLEIELHPKHRRLYDVRFQRERQRLLGLIDDVKANQFQIFRSLTLLRQLALDPALVDEGAVPSAKLDALLELLDDAAAEGHRVLVLSQFTRFLSSARDRAAGAGLASQYLDGSTTDRQAVIDEFRGGSDPVFFVSLKAGGFGLNLVEADYVVLLDPWWNPAVEAQAIDRTHRIGQTKPVFVYRLVAANTIEQKVIALRESKAELFQRVLGGTGEAGGGALTAAEIRELLE